MHRIRGADLMLVVAKPLVLGALAAGCSGSPEAPLRCEIPNDSIGSWRSTPLPEPLEDFDAFVSDGTKLTIVQQLCFYPSSCGVVADLDAADLAWSQVSTMTSGELVDEAFVASSEYIFNAGNFSRSDEGIHQLGGPTFLLERSSYRWHRIDKPVGYIPRNRSGSFWTGSVFGIWGGYGPIDFTKSAHELSVDSDAHYMTQYDGFLFDPMTHEWRVIPPAREPFEQRRDEIPPSIASTWTSRGLFVWGTNPERTDNWGATFDVEAMQWSELDGDGELPPLRLEHKLLTVGDEVFLFGGKTASGEKSRRLFRYELETGAWSEVEVPSWADPIDGTVVDGRLVFLGRCTGGARFDPVTDTWDALSVAGAPPSQGRSHAVGNFLAVTNVYYGHAEANEVWILDLRE